MVNEILSVSDCRRNSFLEIASTKKEDLLKNRSRFDTPRFFSSRELNTLLGLAFTAIIAHDHDTALCRSEMDMFLKYRDYIHDKDMLEIVSISVIQLLESGWSAFKALDYPRYHDDFICLYHYILSSNVVPREIKLEMQRIQLQK